MGEIGKNSAESALEVAVRLVVPKGPDWFNPIGEEIDRQFSAAVLSKHASPESEIAYFKCLLSVIGLMAVCGEVGRRGAKVLGEMN